MTQALPHCQRTKSVAAGLAILIIVGFIAGCASYQMKISDAYSALQSGDPRRAAEALKENALKESDDQLVYLLEYATALQYAGDYAESTRAFLMADKIAEVQDYHSLSRITGSLLLSESMVQYKGEDFEKVMINAMLAINFLSMNKLEDAMVEARRLNLRLQKYKNEAKRDFEQNPFARYISAMIYENDRNFDSAIIDYEEAHRLNPSIGQLPEDLIYAAKKARRPESAQKWQSMYPDAKVDPHRDDPAYGEIVFIYQQGQGPVKQPNPVFSKVPKLFPRHSIGRVAQLNIDGVGSSSTQMVFSSEQVAMKTLDDLYAGLIAKRVAGVAVKLTVAEQVRKDNELLGSLLWIGMNVADQADLRQWSTLPESFQIARVPVKAGTYTVSAAAMSSSNSETGERMPPRTIEVKPRKKTFFTWRSFR